MIHILYGTYEIYLDIINFCFQRFTDRCLARCKRTGSPGFLSLVFFLNACKRPPRLLPSKGCIWNEWFFSFQIRCAWLINSCLLDLIYILCRSCAEMRLCCPMTIKMGWNFSRTLTIIINSERTSFCLWNLDMNQLYFWSALVSVIHAPYLMLIVGHLKFRVSTEIDQSMISYLEILVRDCWYNIEMNVIYLLHWEV